MLGDRKVRLGSSLVSENGGRLHLSPTSSWRVYTFQFRRPPLPASFMSDSRLVLRPIGFVDYVVVLPLISGKDGSS